ncbi:MAG: hypothetical protein RRY34_06090 [Victivallaceae bacterium]
MFWILIVVAVIAFIGVLVFKNNPNQAVAKGGAGICVLILLGAVVGIAVTEMSSGRSTKDVVNASENAQRILAYGIAEKFKGQEGVVFITGSEDGNASSIVGDRKVIYDNLIKYGIPESDIVVVSGFPENILKADPKALISALKSKSTNKTVVFFGLAPTPIVKDAIEKGLNRDQAAFWLLAKQYSMPKNVKAVDTKPAINGFTNFQFSGDDAKDFSELFVIE